jgi:hypothetical protein
MQKQRNMQGSSFIELTAALMVVIPLVLYGIDAATIYMGQSMNAEYCRESCRAAANGPPNYYSAGTNYTPKNRAEQVMKNRYNPKSMIRVSIKPLVHEQVFAPLPQVPFGGPVRGVVTVRSFVTVYPPLPLPFFPQKVNLRTESTFPYTWVMPGTFKPAAGTGVGSGSGSISGTTAGSTLGTTSGSIDGLEPGGTKVDGGDLDGQ